MKEVWTKKWKEVFIWLSSYLSIIAYALVGGYVVVKSDDAELKKTAKTCLMVTLIFTALSALLSLFHYIGGMTDNYYSSSAYDFYSTASTLVSIAKIVVYAVFVIMALFKNRETQQNATKGSQDADKN